MTECIELETKTYQYIHMKTNVEQAFFLLKLGGSFSAVGKLLRNDNWNGSLSVEIIS